MRRRIRNKKNQVFFDAAVIQERIPFCSSTVSGNLCYGRMDRSISDNTPSGDLSAEDFHVQNTTAFPQCFSGY